MEIDGKAKLQIFFIFNFITSNWLDYTSFNHAISLIDQLVKVLVFDMPAKKFSWIWLAS